MSFISKVVHFFEQVPQAEPEVPARACDYTTELGPEPEPVLPLQRDGPEAACPHQGSASGGTARRLQTMLQGQGLPDHPAAW